MEVKYQPVDSIISSESPEHRKPLKVIVVGDSSVGLTSMLVTYTLKKFPIETEPTTLDNYTVNFIVEDQEYYFSFWNVSSQDSYEQLRELIYQNVDCVLVCFSVENQTSFTSVLGKWQPEIEKYCNNVPVILVDDVLEKLKYDVLNNYVAGTKADLRQFHDDCVTTEEANEMKESIGAIKYIECSALADDNLQTVFDEVVQVSIQNKKNGYCFLF